MSRREVNSTIAKTTVIRRWVGNSKQWLDDFLREVPSHNTIVAVVVMGSAVRERGHRRSDFDLLLIYKGKRPTIRAPIEVDIRYVPIEQIEEKIADGHEIVCWALKFGTALFDPECRWEYLERSWRGRIPLPSGSEAELRGQQALARVAEMQQIGDDSAAEDLILAALTQFARKRLIDSGVFPASRPELPDQLRNIDPHDPLAKLLSDAMYELPGLNEIIAAVTELSESQSNKVVIEGASRKLSL